MDYVKLLIRAEAAANTEYFKEAQQDWNIEKWEERANHENMQL